MAFVGKQLAQLRPLAAGVSEALYTPPAGKKAHGFFISMVNSSVSDAEPSIYHDADGAVAGADQLIFRAPVPLTNPTATFGEKIEIENGGTVSVESDVAGAVTFTLYGVEEDI